MKKVPLAFSIIATTAFGGFAVAESDANRFEGVGVSIPVLARSGSGSAKNKCRAETSPPPGGLASSI